MVSPTKYKYITELLHPINEMNKSTLRTAYKAKRNALSEESRVVLDKLLLQQWQSFHLPNDIKCIMGFKPIEKFNEPNILPFIQHLQQQIEDLKVAFPKVSPNTSHVEAIAVSEHSIYEESNLGILEPVSGIIIDPQEIDMILIPLLAFDLRGYRVGYGKGMYDIFLERCKASILKIGISHFDPVPCITDTEIHDIALDICITPQKIYTFH
jgi:5-formyltetrahydrofolate cyclo-ligase